MSFQQYYLTNIACQFQKRSKLFYTLLTRLSEDYIASEKAFFKSYYERDIHFLELDLKMLYFKRKNNQNESFMK